MTSTSLVKRRRFRRRFFFPAALFVLSCATTPPSRVFDAGKLREIDATIEKAIADGKIPGGVLFIERDGATYGRTYGNRSLVPEREPVTPDTIYDAASITKVVATAPSIWMLVKQGRIDLDAPVSRYIPEFSSSSRASARDLGAGAAQSRTAPTPGSLATLGMTWRDEVTVRHLMTHSSGLRPSLPLSDPWSGYEEGIRRATLEEPRNRPGAVFRYSDINYILLGEIVRRVSGEPLDVFAEKNIFEPLGMKDTGFRPGRLPRVAPTERTEDAGMLHGVVHDPTARRMGGVAGHAGMFTTVDDMARFARAVLRGDFFPPEMSQVQSPRGVAVRRAGGFDVDSSYSRPRGELFPMGSFGHTGWTGGFFWIDPYSRTYFVFLSNRVHPDGKGNVVPLQRELGTLVAEAIRDYDFANVPGALERRPGGGVRWVVGGGSAQNGIDVLAGSGYEALRGMRVGLITNHTGIDRNGNPTIDLLRSAPGVNLVALFSPEHGIRGLADDKIGDTTDEITGLPIYSLYGDRRQPSPEQLANIDVLVFDIQDIGARFYTYISTLGMAMDSAAQAGRKFVVLDRVNPIGGTIVEGPVLEGKTDFVAYHDIPIRHGMTVGELARMFREEKKFDVDLSVIQIRGWKRDQWQDEAGLPWINTSPNMRSLNAAALYPGIGILERAVSVGRGTPTPFEVLGAPYIDENWLASKLSGLALPGISFDPVRFTPDASVHKGESCGGVRMTITDRRALRAVDVGIAVATLLNRQYPGQFDAGKTARLLRDSTTLEAIRNGTRPQWDHSAFMERRGKYLIYE